MKVDNKEIEERIVKTATVLIFKKGITGWNMDKLAADSGVAKNTLYKIIKSKEQLIEKIILNHVHEIQIKIITTLKKMSDDYLKTIEEMAVYFPGLLNNMYTTFMYEIFLEYPAIEKKIKKHNDNATKQIITFFKIGIEKGHLRNDISPEFIFELLQAQILYYINSGLNGSELTDKLRIGFNCIINGVKA